MNDERKNSSAIKIIFIDSTFDYEIVLHGTLHYEVTVPQNVYSTHKQICSA